MAKIVELDTSLAEFTYTIAKEMPVSRRRLLPEKFYRAIDTESKAMKFAHKVSPEQRREFFAYLGIEQFIIYADMKHGTYTDFRDVFAGLDMNADPEGGLKKMVQSNVHVSSNKEFCYTLGQLAQMMDSTSYVRSMELIRASFHAKNFKNKLTIAGHKELLEEKDASLYLSKLIHAVLGVTDTCKLSTGIDTESFRVLHYLYMYRHKFFSQDTLVEAFAGSIGPKAIGVSRKKLSDGKLIDRRLKEGAPEYTITGKGILVVNQFRERVIKSLDF